MDSLPLKERMAIELKYLGHTHEDICEATGTPIDTVNGWFRETGKLRAYYDQYAVEMNQKRQEQVDHRITVSDEEFFILTTNIVRRIGEAVQGRKVPLVDKETGNALAGPDGKPIMVEVPPKYDVSDLERVWKIQRIMQGKPVNHEKQEVEETNFEADLIIKELGLSDDDFKDDRIGDTTKKILDYLTAK